MTLRWTWLAAFAVFVVCIPLFAWTHPFFGDWPNHLGMIGYVGESLKAFGRLPATFDTNEAIGRATPMFYGSLYLPPLGALSTVIGARAALTLAVATLLLLQFASVRALLWDVTRDEVVACAAAVIVTWAIYPLTDLYNRAALPEFIAITALQSGACLWALYARDPARRSRAGLGAGLLLAFAAGIHPPTALFGGLTFAVLWLASLLWCPDRKRVLRDSLAIGALGAGVLAPWLYVVTKFHGQLQIVHNEGLTFFPTSLDAVATRWSLLPTMGPEAVSTPNLDPQVNVSLVVAPLLLALVALLAGARDRQARRAFAFAALCAAATWALFMLSTSPSAWNVLPKAFTIIQFPYRLVAFVNLAALGVLTGVLAASARAHGHAARFQLVRIVMAAGVVVAMFGVGCKLPRCLEGGGGADVTDYANPPGGFFGGNDYSTSEAFSKFDAAAPQQKVKLTVGGPKGFGVVGSAHVHADVRSEVSTNVQAFPWNVLTIDGHPRSHDETLSDGVWLGTWIDAGEHEVGYEFHPDRAWSALRALSLGLLAVCSFVAVFGSALAGQLSRRRERLSLSGRRELQSTPTSSASA